MTLAKVRIAALGLDVSALGFGCASLGSRIAPEAGLSALARAYDAGVTWFDVAPSYGDGQAERLLGRFLAMRQRNTVQILTKVGIAPAAPSVRARLLRPAMRAAISSFPGMRATVRQFRPVATKLPLEAALISASLESSLRRFGTDYVDVLALHDATLEEATRDDVLRALEAAVTSGKARTVAIASSPEVAAAGVAVSGVYGIVQMGNNLLDLGLGRFLAAGVRPVDHVTHSVFGNEGAIGRLALRIKHDTKLRNQLAAAGYEGAPLVIAPDLLSDFAFVDNPDGVIVVSMFSERHLYQNYARHALRRDPKAIRALASQLGSDLA